MKTVKVYGTGCPKCDKLERNVREAIENVGVEATVEKVTELSEIMGAGVMLTPALEVDGKVVVSGQVPGPQKIEGWLK